MSYAAAITVVVDLPAARNSTEAELLGKSAADRFLQTSEEPLISCELQEVINYEVD